MDNDFVTLKDQECFEYMATNVPCQKACPAGTNIPSYIFALFDDKPNGSYNINRRSNLFPGVLGRICSRPCEDSCRHGEDELGEPVDICHLKRAASDLRNKSLPLDEQKLEDCGKKVAIVGAGPAGLAAAHDLAINGISVTIFESFDKPGGMLRYGIPEFRLPRDILDEEINQILGLGVALKTGLRIGEDVKLEALRDEYDAVLIATGCYKSNHMSLDNQSLSGVFMGLDFMINVCSGSLPDVGKKVIVVGAGFTAFDCARSALRLGAEDVMICIRRTEEDLTVTEDEIVQAKIEGVKIEGLMLSTRILGGDCVEGVEFVRTRLVKGQSGGKHKIVPIEGSEFILQADSFIVATGQSPQSMFCADKEVTDHNQETFKSSEQGVYATGDYLTGATTVINAIAFGRNAAERIARDLTGREFCEENVCMRKDSITHRERAWDFLPRQQMPTIESVGERLANLTCEMEKGFSKELAKEESKRCYLCYLHYEIDIDRCIYCSYCIDSAPRDCIKLVSEVKTSDSGAITGFEEARSWKKVNAIVIDNSRCIRCGECVRVCPMDCISVTRVELIDKRLED